MPLSWGVNPGARMPVSKKLTALTGLVLLLCLALATPASAHKIKLFATTEGPVISGYAYFPGGGRAKETKIEFLDPAGQKLGEVTTDDQGQFRFEAKERLDHRLVLETGDGHRAEFLVRAEELPSSLPGPGPQAVKAVAETQEAAAPQAQAELGVQVSEARLAELVGQEVARHIAPLREQLEAYEERVRWHDVLGGIGYILGLAGLAFYFLGLRRRG